MVPREQSPPPLRVLKIPETLLAGELTARSSVYSANTPLLIEIEAPPVIEVQPLGLIVDSTIFTVSGPKEVITPTALEFDVIRYFAQRADTIQRHQVLLRRFWGGIPTDSLRTMVGRVRKHFDKIGIDRDALRTIDRVGYILLSNLSGDEE
jgi:DNA-binding response OmpR family regulator